MKIEIASQEFKDGIWWWASLETDGCEIITSEYQRTRELAISKLQRKLERISKGIAYAQGFLK